VDGLDSPIVHCHCLTCQKTQGAAYVTAARVARAHFRLLSGEDVWRAYASTPGKLRRFCGTCGSHILSEWVDQPQVILRVATLDDDPGARPAGRIWVSHDRPWLTEAEAVPRHDESMPGR
jgi:ADP-ribosyl-[dinitrogen reductase] hydrolase